MRRQIVRYGVVRRGDEQLRSEGFSQANRAAIPVKPWMAPTAKRRPTSRLGDVIGYQRVRTAGGPYRSVAPPSQAGGQIALGPSYGRWSDHRANVSAMPPLRRTVPTSYHLTGSG